MGVMLTSCFAVLLLSATCYAHKGACDIPTVEIGQTATLTCHYNEDVWELQQKIIILHYRSSFDENPETILFSSTFDGVLDYYTHPEYVLRNTKNGIQLEIPRVAKKHAGRYACHVVHPNSFEECSFTPQEPPDFTNNSVSTTHSDIISTPESDTDHEYPMAIIIVVIAGIMIVIIISVTAIVYNLKRSRFSSKDVEKTNHEQINTTERRNDIQYSEVKEQEKSSHDDRFGSTNDVHTDTMQTCLRDDHIEGTEEELVLCQNVLPVKECTKIFQKGEEFRHKTSTEDEDHGSSDSSSLSPMEDFSDSSDSGIQT